MKVNWKLLIGIALVASPIWLGAIALVSTHPLLVAERSSVIVPSAGLPPRDMPTVTFNILSIFLTAVGLLLLYSAYSEKRVI